MKVAPDAEFSDGLLDVVTIGDIGRLEFLRCFPGVYNGTHLTHPKVSAEKTAEVLLQSPEMPLIEVDGEILGETPARFRVLPSALSVAI